MRQHRAPARADVPHPREAVRRHQRLGQAQQLVDGDRRGREPARPGQRPARQRPVPGVPHGRHPRRQRARRPAPREHRRRRPGPPPGRQRGAAGDHVDLPRLAARGRRRAARPRARPRRPRRAARSTLGRDLAAGAAQGRHRPQPDLAVRLHGQQVRVPGGRLVGADLLAADRAQHGRRGLARAARRRAGEAQAGRLHGPDQDPVEDRRRQQAGPVRGQRLLRGVARRGRQARAAQQPDDRRRAAGR